MTHEKMKRINTESAAVASSIMRIGTNNSIHEMHNLRQKMQFQQRSSHQSPEGQQQHNATFVATLCTTFGQGELPRIPVNAKTVLSPDGVVVVELCNTGEARSKKQATALAAFDFLVQLTVECGVDLRNPPDIRKMRQDEERQQFKDTLARSEMLLELLLASRYSRPKFVTEKVPSGKEEFVTEISMRVDHDWKKLFVTGPPGKSKAESQDLAVVAAAAEPLENLVGQYRIQKLRGLIESSPAQHIAALTVRPLPEEAVEELAAAIGSPAEQKERLARLEEVQALFEERFAQRMASSWRSNLEREQGKFNGASDPSASLWKRKQKVLQLMEDEERIRLEKALSDPVSPQGVMKSIRDALPIKAIRDSLLRALKTEHVVVVSGGTGSGKSTQCPQYILEDAISRLLGAETRIVVTQPRRIAASSVAERVAAERDETLGNSVGYSVRLSSIPPRDAGSIEFVTTGVLLRRLMHDRTLEGVSHVMIDEVHERDINTDFLLVLLRDLVAERPDLRVVLMSATLDADSFSKYFTRGTDAGQVPLLSVPTKPRHPVDIIHLEDVAGDDTRNFPDGLRETYSSELQRLAQALLQAHDQQLQLDLEEAEAEELAALQLEVVDEGGERELLANASDSDSDEDVDTNLKEEQRTLRGRKLTRSTSRRRARSISRLRTLRQVVAMRRSSGDAPVQLGRRRVAQREISDITVALVAKMAKHVAELEMTSGRKGSILCFLPGWDEIKAAMFILEECSPELHRRLIIIPLHSSIPKEEQQRIFDPAPDGKMKVILATNIAESSVTINDALAIVDSGLAREMNWDAESAMSTMCTVPTSKASATQRTGRAGRVTPGKCYRLYSRGTLQAMPERPTPEIKRAGLENTCLQTCSMTRDGVQQFLSRAMDPPPRETVAFAVDRLKKLGAINVGQTGEVLSPLGRLLSRLPLDPAMGRMLIVGCVMQCLDPVLTAAACFSSRDPFYTPPGMRDEARKIRQSFCSNSDLRATVRAYNTFIEKRQTEGWDLARAWATDNFISPAALSNISSVKSQLLHELQQIGLVHERDLDSRVRRGNLLKQDAFVNQHAGNESLYTAVWASGLPDNLAARRQLGHFGTLRTRMEDHAGLHPSSVAFHRKPPRERIELSSWFFYHEMMLSSQVFIRNCTAITPEQIMLFGGLSFKSLQKPATDESASNHLCGHTLLDDWIVVDSMSEMTLDLLTAARLEINAAVAFKVMSPRKPLPEASQEIIDAVAETFNILDDRACTEYTNRNCR
jgi:ATP-dependent RNA helicase DHX36